MSRALVFNGESSDVVEIEVDKPRPGEVKVSIAASGVCHTDVSVIEGGLGVAMPIVLGHEGAGVVTEVGDGVTSVAVGDHVALSCMPQCGTCYYCVRGQWPMCELQYAIPPELRYAVQLDGTSRFHLDGHDVHQFCFLGTFSEETVVPELCAIPISRDLPLDLASIVGCSVVVGLGAARRIASIRPGDTVAVLGCGGVGLNAIQGARLAGAGQIIGIDNVAAQADASKLFGATHVVSTAGGVDAVEAVKDLTAGRGADVTIEMVGLERTTLDAIRMTRPGGEIVLVGLGAPITIDLTSEVILSGKILKGCFYGSANAREDFVEIAELYARGDLLLDQLISERFSLDEFDRALHHKPEGSAARPLIVHDNGLI